MKRYLLKKDCPHGVEGDVFIHEDLFGGGKHCIPLQKVGECWTNDFPTDGFEKWFEEIEEMKPFTKEQVEAINGILDEERPYPHFGDGRIGKLKVFLDENTEK